MGIRWNRVADTCVPLTFSMGIGLHPRAGGMSRSLHARRGSGEGLAIDSELSNSLSGDHGVGHGCRWLFAVFCAEYL